ncbi:MAG: hypothetical protein AAF750_06955 [Planctomycetota bacterium]
MIIPSRTQLTTCLALVVFVFVTVGCQTTPPEPATQPAAQTQPDEETGWRPLPKPEPRKTILQNQREKVSRIIRRGRY